MATARFTLDPASPPLTTGELERVAVARRVQDVRAALNLTQEAFAARYGIPVATLRQWELGRPTPDRTSLAYLRVIAALAEEVAKALRAA
jgi:putative transcriptional regulator